MDLLDLCHHLVELGDSLKPYDINFLINWTQKTVVFFGDNTVDEVDPHDNVPVVVQRSPTYIISHAEMVCFFKESDMNAIAARITLELLFPSSR